MIFKRFLPHRGRYSPERGNTWIFQSYEDVLMTYIIMILPIIYVILAVSMTKI